MDPLVAELFTKCATCDHPALNHIQSRRKDKQRTHCCYGDSKSLCQCKLYVRPVTG
jgi:hypothetical protein